MIVVSASLLHSSSSASPPVEMASTFPSSILPPRLSGKDSAQNYITSGCNCNSSQKLPWFTSFTTTLFETLLFMPLTSLLLGQDSMLMLFIYAGFHNRQLARTRLDCDLRTPSLVEYPTLLLATRTYQAIVGLDPALCLVSEVSYT